MQIASIMVIMEISLKILMDNGFSIRVNAVVVNKAPEHDNGVWELKFERDQLSDLIREGCECEINTLGSESMAGQVLKYRPAGNREMLMTIRRNP